MRIVSASVNKQQVLVKSDGENKMIRLSDILYIESSNNSVILYTLSGKIECRQKISYLEEMLGSTFYRVHRCYIINMKYVTSYTSSVVELENKIRIPLSRRRYSHFACMLTTARGNR